MRTQGYAKYRGIVLLITFFALTPLIIARIGIEKETRKKKQTNKWDLKNEWGINCH